MLSGEPGTIRSRCYVVLEDQPFEAALLVQNRHFLVVQGPAEHIGRGVDVGVHEAGDRADCRGRGWEDADLSKHLARIENRRETGGTDDRDPGPEKLTPAGVMAARAMIGAAEVDRAGRIRRPQLSVNFHRGR
jgi:hypothetical protein